MRTHIIQTNFTAGEVTPKVLGRVDVGRYANAAKTAENVTVVVQGGLRRRDGLQWLAKAKDVGLDADGHPKAVRLIPFVVSREEAYVLEVGEKYIRYFQNGGAVLSDPNDVNSAPYETPTPYLAEDLAELNFSQGADTMFFAHSKYAPRELKRNGQQQWDLTPLVLDPAPFAKLDDMSQPKATAFVNFIGPVGRIVEIRLAKEDSQLTAVSWPASGEPTYWTDIDTKPAEQAGMLEGFAWSSTVDATVTTGAAKGWGSDSPDVGKYVRINGGLIKILYVPLKGTSGRGKSYKAIGVIRSVLGFLDGAGGDDWTLEQTIWGDDPKLGWPSCVAMHQQRLLFANTKRDPQTIWGSAIRVFGDFELGYMDDQAYTFQLASDQINPITALFSLNSLVALTHSGEFLINGTSGAISPTNINVRAPTNYGAAPVRPVRVGAELMYIQRAGRKVLDMNYDPDSTAGFTVSNITLLAEHMTKNGIVDMTYQQEPEGLIHLVTGDGQLITVTYDKESEVTGWTRNHTGAVYNADGEPTAWDMFRNVASIPHVSGVDHCYAAVRREVNGVEQLYIELFDPTLHVDSALKGRVLLGNPGVKDWTALDHLEAAEVDIVADGNVMPRQTVASGKITLSRNAEKVDIGLPFYSRVRTLDPEFQTPGGSSSGMHVATVHLYIRLFESIGMTINGDNVPFRRYGKNSQFGAPPEKFTGDVKWQTLGQDNNEVLIEQRQPLPFHLLAVIRTITAN